MTTMLATLDDALWHGLDEVPPGWGPCVITIGMFDGIHRGHAGLIAKTVEVARTLQLPALLLTFDPHPARVTGPPRNTAALSTPQRRPELARQLGVDVVLVLPFTSTLANITAHEFVTRVLVETLRVNAVIVGHNFRFGARGAGDLDTLCDLGRQLGFSAEGVGLLHTSEIRYSSIHVRTTCLAAGDVTAAAQALGRPHRVAGQLAGDVLQVPTGTALPADGHYHGMLAIDGAQPHPVEVVLDLQHVRIRSSKPLPAAGMPPAELDFLRPVGRHEHIHCGRDDAELGAIDQMKINGRLFPLVRVVETRGIEPLTPALQRRCSAN
jgi:riboflavin kinase / FMN adenylyltransferase